MKNAKIIPILAMLCIGIMSSCGSGMDHLELDEVDLTANQSNDTQLISTVGLGVAGDFTILSKSGITNVPTSYITGDVGTSPITGAALLLTCNEVTGTIYTVDAAGPLPCRVTNPTLLTTAVLNMQAAYTDAAGRFNPDFLNLGAGVIGGETLTPGLYKWTSTLLIANDITLHGGPDDIWIFQVSGTFNMSSAVRINLAGGAQAKNIFWQTAGAVTLGTTSNSIRPNLNCCTNRSNCKRKVASTNSGNATNEYNHGTNINSYTTIAMRRSWCCRRFCNSYKIRNY
ncbi:MAG: hypothetical protein ACI86L_002021 [Dokdonia sp.]|jgi:hypothetical protein